MKNCCRFTFFITASFYTHQVLQHYASASPLQNLPPSRPYLRLKVFPLAALCICIFKDRVSTSGFKHLLESKTRMSAIPVGRLGAEDSTPTLLSLNTSVSLPVICLLKGVFSLELLGGSSDDPGVCLSAADAAADAASC